MKDQIDRYDLVLMYSLNLPKEELNRSLSQIDTLIEYPLVDPERNLLGILKLAFDIRNKLTKQFESNVLMYRFDVYLSRVALKELSKELNKLTLRCLILKVGLLQDPINFKLAF